MKSWLRTLVVAVLCTVTSISGWADLLVPDPPTSTTRGTSGVGLGAPARVLTASDMADLAGVFYGNVVQVRAIVRWTYGLHAFTLTDQPLLAAPEVLVLVPQPLAAATEGYTVLVRGTAAPFNRAQLERQYDWFRPPLFGGKGRLDDWQKERILVLVAQSVRNEQGLDIVARPGMIRLGIGQPAAGITGMGTSAEPPPPLDDLVLLFHSDNALRFVNRPVILSAITVWRVLAPEIITVGTDVDHQLLVRLPDPPRHLVPGDSVNLLGSIRALKGAWNDSTLPAGTAPPTGPVFIQADEIEKR